MEKVLQTFNLSKRYKNRLVLDGVNITVERGDVYGFVGENGSGKTTVIRLITGLISPTSGSFTLFDGQPCRVGRVGAVVETPSIYLNMSASDNLRMQSAILGLKSTEKSDTLESKIKQTLELVGLGDLYLDQKHAGNFSLGMRQRLGIAMVLLGDPEFIVLDEPMNGLDPAGIVEVRELILSLNRDKGITFLISSHILTELSLVATKYGIISKGKILKEITSDELRKACRSSITLESPTPERLFDAIKDGFDEENITLTPSGVVLYGDAELTPVLQAALGAGVALTSVNCSKASIEEYYLSVVGGNKNA